MHTHDSCDYFRRLDEQRESRERWAMLSHDQLDYFRRLGPILRPLAEELTSTGVLASAGWPRRSPVASGEWVVGFEVLCAERAC